MATELRQGMRRYTCLVPIVVLEKATGQQVRYEHVHIVPVTRRTERRWQDGEIQGPYGALEALIDELTVEPYFVIEEMQHPDVELFNKEFLAHLPRSIADMLANGRYPAPPAPPPSGYDPEQDPDDDPIDRAYDGPFDPQPSPDSPASPEEPAYVGPDTADDPGASSTLSGLNLELAEMGPDESMGTPQQRETAEAAFQARANRGGDGKDLARDLVAEDESQSPALRAAVERAARESAALVPQPEPKKEIDGGWVGSPRDPFNPEPAPPKVSTIKPPTRLSAEEVAKLAGVPTVDKRTGREAVFVPPADYVPDMSAAGYEEPASPAAQRPANNAFGIGDIE